MKRSLIFYASVTALIILANTWLCSVMSTTQFSLVPIASRPVWQTALTWLAVIPQVPSLFVSKMIADGLHLADFGWLIATSLISTLIYFPLTWLWLQKRKGVQHYSNG